MEEIVKSLDLAVQKLSDENYAYSLAFYRLWFDVGQTYHQIPHDQIFYAIWNNRGTSLSMIDPAKGKLIHSTAHLIVRFASDAESDPLLAPHSSRLQSRLCARILREFFSGNQRAARSERAVNLYADVNLLAHWANLGYVGEAAIRNHILQSLISHPKRDDHQADAIIIQFKVAGATFETYTDPSVVDRCFELLKDHKYSNPYFISYNSSNPENRTRHGWPEVLSRGNGYDLMKKELIQVRGLLPVKGSHQAKPDPQEVITLRERSWEGLPPPPVLKTRKSNPLGTYQRDPAATPVVTFLGLHNRDLNPQIPHPPPPEPATAPEPGPILASSPTPITHSPSVSITSLSDVTIADGSDDEPPIDPTIADASDDELPNNPAAEAPHETFYLEDGNVEVLCGNTLFRVHTTVLSFHSPSLRRMFAQTSLTTAESPNGCPRIRSSDMPKDFTALLKMIYLPGSVSPPECHWIVPLTVHLSPGSLNRI